MMTMSSLLEAEGKKTKSITEIVVLKMPCIKRRDELLLQLLG
jgi:hypothetical protein